MDLLLRPELPQLKYFDIELTLRENYFTPNDNTFKMFSYFKDLKVLTIRISLSEKWSRIWSKTIESIFTNCLQLEYFSLECKYSGKFNAKECFDSFIHFSRLKKLYFRVIPEQLLIEKFEEQITDLTPLQNCKNLLVLNLRLKAINSNVFNGIDLIIPQLKQLSFEFGLKITDEVLKSMANLKNLKQIRITSGILKITSEGLRVLTNDCKRLKTITICGVIRVYDKNERKNINQLIETHPNIYFDFKYIEEKN